MFHHNSSLRSLDRSDAANNIYTAIPLHRHDCRSPTWSLTLTKHDLNPNPDRAMPLSYSLTIAANSLTASILTRDFLKMTRYVWQVVNHEKSLSPNDFSERDSSYSKDWRTTVLEWWWQRRLEHMAYHSSSLSWTLLLQVVAVLWVRWLVYRCRHCSLFHALTGTTSTEFSPTSSSVRLFHCS